MAKETKEKTKTEEAVETLDLKRFLSSMRLDVEAAEPVPVIQDELQTIAEEVSDEDRFISGLAALLMNIDTSVGRFDKGMAQEVIAGIDVMINDQINEIMHDSQFKEMESNWRSLNDLILNTNFRADVMIDILDVSKDELYEDFESNAVDITGSALFQKVYISEYDQYGGKPFGSIVGLYDFEHTPRDEFWLRTMGKVAAASHAPFVGAVSPKFFGCDSIEEFEAIKDLEGLMSHPKYGSWNALRKVRGDSNEDYLWGSASILFAQNMVRSFEQSGWCQYLRGPKGGGLVSGLPVHMFNVRGEEEMKLPVEMAIPDYRELEFANAGFMPLVYRKGTADACFFSCQSLKKPKKFKDPKDSENAQLVTNLSYTYSITRIAHYVKSIMRDNIGSSADASYIKNSLQNWLLEYVTTVVDPDDLTLRFYPFKAASVDVVEREGMIGWYDCAISVLPHIQFEGMDVELKLDARL
jgi:type VI secretion system protein ImpC